MKKQYYIFVIPTVGVLAYALYLYSKQVKINKAVDAAVSGTNIAPVIIPQYQTKYSPDGNTVAVIIPNQANTTDNNVTTVF